MTPFTIASGCLEIVKFGQLQWPDVLQEGERVLNSDKMSNNHWQRDKRPGVDDLVLLNNVGFA